MSLLLPPAHPSLLVPLDPEEHKDALTLALTLLAPFIHISPIIALERASRRFSWNVIEEDALEILTSKPWTLQGGILNLIQWKPYF